MFTQKDIDQIKQKGMSVEQVNEQIKLFRDGIPFLNIIRPAVINDGIIVLDDFKLQELISAFENKKPYNTIIKFTPASGAATRMFKALYEQHSKPEGAEISKEVEEVLNSLSLFAFYADLEEKIKDNNESLSKLLANKDVNSIIEYILTDKGLNYGNLPKGLLKFHKYKSGSRTSVEEHIVEGAMYAKNKNDNVKIHFTVSEEHMSNFKVLINKVIDDYIKKFKVNYSIDFSIQKSSTDTIAVDDNNEPFRELDRLVFRPGGHGALLENLNDIDGDIVFIKNIDNVVPDHLKEITVMYKKAIAGLLLQTQEQTFNYISRLNSQSADDNLIKEIKSFIEGLLGYKFASSFNKYSIKEKTELLKLILDRPIRVCGMVKNEDQPGGGPFWTQQPTGEQSLQILESSQFDLNQESQKRIFNGATHFNPVDLVISLKNYKGEKYELSRFKDPQTGFISIKSKDGRSLKALELPGLWNGAMSNWNTIFVEVPIETFNPVKTLLDLLRKEHQNVGNNFVD